MTRLLFGSWAVVVAVGVVGVSPASAHRAPARQVRVLRHELRNMTLRRDALKAQLAAAEAQREADVGVVAGLQSQVASLQAQIAAVPAVPAVPAPLTAAVDEVRREVEWAQGSVSAPLGGRLVAEAAMDYTVGHISTAAYGYLELVGAPVPGYNDDPNVLLAGEAGICGQSAHVFQAIVEAFGFPTRQVFFTYTDPGGGPDGHVAVEVAYGGGWHFFDPTFGQFWTAGGDVLAIADARAGGGSLVRDAASFTNIVEDAAFGDDTWFETDPVTVVSYG